MRRKLTLAILLSALLVAGARAQERTIPHNQSAPPNDPYSAEEAAARMTVPPGFTVEVVACEPDLVNPVAMAFDDRGRIWVVESLEYPRMSAGPGRDRIKILEDTDHDGRVDDVKVFAEGLNIPSGIALGHGGVWVVNSPDLLLLTDTDGDDRADTREVIVTGFGRTDTHELPNSLTWGPDGYLYGLNGVFNYSRVEQAGRVWEFTCAMFRVHPRTHEFELFAEGTSNPWGIAWNGEGQPFLSACVIDHLWHLTESGYYHRQAGPYPEGTWKIESIVDHRHQKAAYCGIHYFDSPAYPEPYRNRLYMGNIHGNCLNVDSLTRHGATYRGHGEDDFLQANDAWFMPVSQKTGPDGCLYVLDWYDRYHCYQDARRDPEGIDRLKGRLYRVRYQDTPRAADFDLAQLATAELVDRLGDPNDYVRERARVLLSERLVEGDPAAVVKAWQDPQKPQLQRRQAWWTLVSAERVTPTLARTALRDDDSVIRSFAVRALGNHGLDDDDLWTRLVELAQDPSPDVRLQVAIAAPKLRPSQSLPVLMEVLARSQDDGLTPQIVWKQLHGLLAEQQAEFLVASRNTTWPADHPGMPVLERGFAWILEHASEDPAEIALLLQSLRENPAGVELAVGALQQIARTAGGQESDVLRGTWRQVVGPELARMSQGDDATVVLWSRIAAAALGEPESLDAIDEMLDGLTDDAARQLALAALFRWRLPRGEQRLANFIRELRPETDDADQAIWLGTVDRCQDSELLAEIAASWARWSPQLQPQLVETLSGRRDSAQALLNAIQRGDVPRTALNANQARKILAQNDSGLTDQLHAVWGVLRLEADPQRQERIEVLKRQIQTTPGDPVQGKVLFPKLCGQCHRFHGVGEEVGPDLTTNGRGSFDALLSNVFDPSLVIGAAYQATVIQTVDGRIETGLLIADRPDAVVLRIQGGKEVRIARDEIEALENSPLSLMPDRLEDNLTPQELADLFAYLMLEPDPTRGPATWIPGSVDGVAGESEQPGDFARLLAFNFPGFACEQVGEGGLALLTQHQGRVGVVRTHPISREEPCRLTRRLAIPADGATQLQLSVSHHERQGDWLLKVVVNGREVLEREVGPETTQQGWADLTVDLSEFAGQTIDLALENHANNWSYEFAYWGPALITHATAESSDAR